MKCLKMDFRKVSNPLSIPDWCPLPDAANSFEQENAADANQCPECEQNMDDGMNFCANCGRQLWHR